MIKKKIILLTTLYIAAFLALVGCSKTDESEEITLVVQTRFYSDFMQNYGIPFELEHDNIRVEVSDYISNEKDPEYADLLYLSGFASYEQFVAEDKLAPLDQWVLGQDEALSNQGFARAKAIELLKYYSEGQLFALPFDLQSYALYYNADLFDKYDVPYPSDIVTWEEVLQLASQFPTESDAGKRIFGLTHSETRSAPMTAPTGEVIEQDSHHERPPITSGHIAYYGYMNRIARDAGLSPWNDEWEMTIHTPEWEQILNDVIPRMKAGHIDIHLNTVNFFDIVGHPFWDGRAAMYVSDLKNAEYLARKEESFQWNVVAGPVYPGHSVSLDHQYHFRLAYGMNNQSQHKEEAWQLLKFMFEKSFTGNEIGGVSLEPFYMLVGEKYDVYPDIPVRLVELNRLISNIINDVLEDRLSIKEALQQIQEEGQQILNNQRFDYENSAAQEEAHE